MKATIEIPDALHRRLKARAALEGRSVRDVTIELYEGWLLQVEVTQPIDESALPAAATAWSRRWSAIGAQVAQAASDGPTTREILTADRR